MKNKKLNRKPRARFLSVVPVTSREKLVPVDLRGAKTINLRALMLQRIRIIAARRERDLQEMNRLTAAVIALGKRK